MIITAVTMHQPVHCDMRMAEICSLIVLANLKSCRERVTSVARGIPRQSSYNVSIICSHTTRLSIMSIAYPALFRRAYKTEQTVSYGVSHCHIRLYGIYLQPSLLIHLVHIRDPRTIPIRIHPRPWLYNSARQLHRQFVRQFHRVSFKSAQTNSSTGNKCARTIAGVTFMNNTV